MGCVKKIPSRELIPGVDEDNGGRYVASTIALVKGKGVNAVVDPGLVRKRQQLIGALKKANLTLKEVTPVFIRHHHPVHTSNIALFLNATVVEFWTTYKNDLWEDHPDKYAIAPDIKVRRTPGHTNEDTSLVVQAKYDTVVFTHVWWFLSDITVFPQGLFPPMDSISDNQNALNASRELVFDIADCIVPGHGSPFPNTDKPGAACFFGDYDNNDD